MNELVSIIIPSYGGGESLERAVDSVISQTYKNIEIIVVDDNGLGTDNQKKTATIMKKYAGKDNVKYICHNINRNGSVARNTGVKKSNGVFIGLLDDDDVFLPNKVERQVKRIKSLSDEYALTYCSHETYKGNSKVGEKHVTFSGYMLYELLIHSFAIGSTSFLIRRSVWDEMGGFDESFKRHQDWEFTARVAAKYKVDADDFIGFRRYLEFRNSSRSPGQAKVYREHYLHKMKPLIERFPEEQQKKIYLENRMDVALMWLKKKDVLSYLKECREIRAGRSTVTFLFDRIIYRLKNKKSI